MTENAVENPVCSACGAPVRSQAQFCYNCGSAVAPEEIKKPASDDELTYEAKPTTNLNDNGDNPIAKPFDTLVEARAETKSDVDIVPPLPTKTTAAETKLKSAASLRRGNRTPAQKKTVEVIWDEPENAPNVWFLVAAFVLVLFAVGILMAMLYIK